MRRQSFRPEYTNSKQQQQHEFNLIDIIVVDNIIKHNI